MAVLACDGDASQIDPPTLCLADRQIVPMGELTENGSKSIVVGILGAVPSLSRDLVLSSQSPSGCIRRTSDHVTKVESPGRDHCESCSKRSRPSDM